MEKHNSCQQWDWTKFAIRRLWWQLLRLIKGNRVERICYLKHELRTKLKSKMILVCKVVWLHGCGEEKKKLDLMIFRYRHVELKVLLDVSNKDTHYTEYVRLWAPFHITSIKREAWGDRSKSFVVSMFDFLTHFGSLNTSRSEPQALSVTQLLILMPHLLLQGKGIRKIDQKSDVHVLHAQIFMMLHCYPQVLFYSPGGSGTHEYETI